MSSTPAIGSVIATYGRIIRGTTRGNTRGRVNTHVNPTSPPSTHISPPRPHPIPLVQDDADDNMEIDAIGFITIRAIIVTIVIPIVRTLHEESATRGSCNTAFYICWSPICVVLPIPGICWCFAHRIVSCVSHTVESFLC